jgi:hypothetical protein
MDGDMTEADRIAREQARQRQMQKEAEQAKSEQAWADLVHRLRTEIARDIPAVLGLLKQRGYPNIKELTLMTPRMFGQDRRDIRAAWEITSRQVQFYDSFVTEHIYLLGDGALAITRFETYKRANVYNPKSLSAGHVEIVYEGLRRLLSSLQATP